MRIKRLAFFGTFVLLVVCMGLYLLLDRTLSQDKRKVPLKEETYIIELSKLTSGLLVKPNSTRPRVTSSFLPDKHALEPAQCSDPVLLPTVDVQMSEVYDSLKFDNVNGGAWKQGWPITYSSKAFTPDRKLRVFVVPHSHNDPGWKKTFEEYYTSQTRYILNNLINKLGEDDRRRFIWAEMSFFTLWWSEASNKSKERIKTLINKGQLEIVTGGWVMTDEANSHFYSVIEQLTLGHQWLLDNLNYRPRSSWSIDPFGVSASLPMILKKSGFDALAIQRTHYSVKKYLARKKQLEFRWRQLWDGSGYTDLLTHMMPFYSYDVPHTCGPDPKVCCQFDFKRLPGSGYGFTCPWRVPPKIITDQNIANRADLLVDQYKKKAQLYSTNVLLVPLGDDFRYDQSTEWDNQFKNYQRLFDYINNNSAYNVHASFGTLSEYFKAVEESKPAKYFPTLTGDFFTYADRDDHYWSGYFTSRPFYKRMDRVLMSSLRSAEILLSLAVRREKKAEAWPNLLGNLTEARASHSLFQHHDGITGTAKDHVVIDYANKMLKAIETCQHIIQQATRFLLLDQPDPAQSGDEVFFIVEDDDRLMTHNPNSLLTFPSGVAHRRIVIVNTLTFARREVVTFRVQDLHVKVKTGTGAAIDHQISPHCGLAEKDALCYELSFVAEIQPLSTVTYIVEPADPGDDFLANVVLFDSTLSKKYVDWPAKNVEEPKDISIENDYMSVAFDRMGFLKSVSLKTDDTLVTMPVSVSFLRYNTRQTSERSGAYLFLPSGPGEQITVTKPHVTVIRGKLKSQVFSYFENVVHVTTVHTSLGYQGRPIEIQNLIDISRVNSNYELAMRISTNIENENVFFTDLNSLQMIRRKWLAKIPLQANFYPMTSAAYIQDPMMRMTVISGQALGVASLNPGQLEIMQDRRLLQDDNRGLDQGVQDNRPTLAVFRLFFEPRDPSCDITESTWGALSGLVHMSLETLTSPAGRLSWAGDPQSDLRPSANLVKAGPTPKRQFLPLHMSLVALRTLSDLSTGVVFRSTSLDKCYSEPQYSTQGSLNLTSILGLSPSDKVFESTLTFNQIGPTVANTSSIPMCDNSLVSFNVPNL
ncbi:Alpha-mann_mid [Nesidiocoris tenuis]|nr:Alpha-mann_mid [Nesidiocoris tenuis]